MTLSLEERRFQTPRVDFQTVVRLLPSGRRQSIHGWSTDLSLTGMHVFSSEVCPIGTELACDLALPRLGPNLALRGRVSWVAPKGDSHMGIEFIDLTDLDVSVLQGLVAEAPPLPSARPAKVWFEGLPQPVPGRVLVREEGIALTLALPYLVEGSEVVLSFQDGAESLTGTLRGIRLERECGPGHALRAFVDLPPRSSAGGAPSQTWTRWPPPLPPPLPFVIRDQDLFVIESLTASDEVIPLEIAPLEIAGLQDASGSSAVSGSITAHDAPSSAGPALEPVRVIAATGVPARSVSRASRTAPLARIEASQWELRSPTAILTTASAERRSHRRRRTGLWLAASAMAGIAAASMVHTDLFPRAREKLAVLAEKVDVEGFWKRLRSGDFSIVEASPPSLPLDEATPAIVKSEPAGTSTAEARPAAVPEQGKASSAAAQPQAVALDWDAEGEADGGEEAAKDPSKAPVAGAASNPKAPRVLEEKVGTTLVIPVAGSMRDARSYPLADPDGLVVNLPFASSRARGDHPLDKGGFRMVWVRPRTAGGLQIRIFSSGKMPEHRLSLEKTAVRLTLLRPTSAAAGKVEAP
jgi:hypothetical protein